MNNGLIYEVKAKLKLLEMGFKISQPLCPQSKYDLVVDNGKDLIKVQVKKTSRKNNANSFRCRLCTSDKAGKYKGYKKDEVDMFVIFIEPLDMWYVIPFDDTDGKKEITIDPKKPVYEAYEDAWLLFKDVSKCR